jgi:hypothetical protein
MNRKFVLAMAIAVAVISGAQILRASDPVGIYAVIERVVFEPNENTPQRIQVWGAFSLSEGKLGDFYQAPQRGYLYLTLPPGKETVAKKEWADLKSMAGTNQGVGFGAKYKMKVHVRKSDEKPENPEVHPIGIGVVKADQQPATIQALKELIRKRQ